MVEEDVEEGDVGVDVEEVMVEEVEVDVEEAMVVEVVVEEEAAVIHHRTVVVVGEGVVVAETVVEGINQHRHKIQNLIDFMYTIRTFKGKKRKDKFDNMMKQ